MMLIPNGVFVKVLDQPLVGKERWGFKNVCFYIREATHFEENVGGLWLKEDFFFGHFKADF